MDIASSSTGPAKGRRRIRQQAVDILEDYFREVSQNPSFKEKEALLEKIKVTAIPGCEHYDLGRMLIWFSNRRQRNRMKEQKERALQHPDNNNDCRFPSLTQAAIQHLTVLASNQTHPSSELLKTWAALLASSGAKEQDVVNWVRYRNQEQQLQHLPTPSDTTMTPEPLATSQSPIQNALPRLYKREAMSPTISTLYPSEHAQSTPSQPSPKLLPTSNNDHMLQLNQQPRVPAIIRGVGDALASPQTTPNAAPKTAAEFEAMFSPFEQRISLLLRALETT